MTKTIPELRQLAQLTWDDLEEWAGGKIVARGKTYQRQGRVTQVAITEDNGLLGWMEGTERYAAKVVLEDDELPFSICTCPYEIGCKHGVALVLECLKLIEEKRNIPKAEPNDGRLKLLGEDGDETAEISKNTREQIGLYLKNRTKGQLIDL